ncbi:MAG: bifunctional tetrahydrofolate synthase/dihydrofolate synthase [Granulosicoccaceae bacterium]
MSGKPTAASSLGDWLGYLEQLHPENIELGLGRVSMVWQACGAPQLAPLVITVAGTNGKGSCIRLMESMLCAAGYRVGSYTSPHLLRYNERVRVDGQDSDDAALTAAFDTVEQARGDVPLTYFEFGTLAAFLQFAGSELDIVLLEVGLGGRLDAVNIIDADIALITPIDIDHVDWLGLDRVSIGREKAGIMRSCKTVVCAETEPPFSVIETAQQLDARLLLAGRDYGYHISDDGSWSWWLQDKEDDWQLAGLPAPALAGTFQYANAAAALAVLSKLPAGPLTLKAIHIGLCEVSLPGRFYKFSDHPPVYGDVAHNPQSARALAELLASRRVSGRTLGLFGVMADKDIPGIVAPLRKVIDSWYVASPGVMRAAGVGDVVAVLTEAGISDIHTAQNIAGALAMAKQVASDEDRVIVFGSFYTVAEAMQEAV